MRNTKLKAMTGTALLAAVIVVLQLVVGGISVGPFTITLSLIPMIIGAIVYGPVSGGILGAVLAALIAFASISGKDFGGQIMFNYNPVATIVLIFLKTTLAGLVSGFVYNALKDKNETLGVILAAVLAPVTNTGLFSLGCVTIFIEVVKGWAAAAGYTATFSYIITGLVGVNFLVEVGLNVILIPVIMRILKAVD